MKRKYYGSRINNCKNNSAKLWKTLKELLPNAKSGGSINSVVDKKNGARCTEHKDIADSFNYFFANIGKQLASNFVATDSTHVQSNNSECKFSFHDIDDEFLLKQLLSLNGWQLAKMKKSIPDMSLP